jgi:PncC family amidohydrolase
MAEGARLLTGADVAVSVTGIAGPGGGSSEKPVGLVWFAVATKSGTRSEKAIFAGSREEVRRSAAMHAVGMLTVATLDMD